MPAFALGTFAVLIALAYFQAPILVWTLAAGVMLASWAVGFEWSGTAIGIVLGLFAVFATILPINGGSTSVARKSWVRSAPGAVNVAETGLKTKLLREGVSV